MSVWSFSDRRRGPAMRTALRLGASGGVMAAMLLTSPTQAQLRALGRTAEQAAARAAVAATATPAITPTMSQIMARRQTYQARVAQQTNIVAQANAVARQAALATQQTVRNGIGQGGLQQVANPTTQTGGNGLQIWIGADTQLAQTESNGAFNVTVNQTQSRALLSWESFNVGRDTTLTFNQKGNSDWTVVNRVVGGIDPVTGRLNPNLAPSASQILGSIKADGTVYVLNRSGIIFGATSQLNLRSLVASSLELGSARGTGSTRPLTLDERNTAYLQNGILPGDVSGLLSAVAGESHGAVTLQQGGRINATGGFVILAAPQVVSAGEIKAGLGGQVSLEAGTQIDAYVSSGSASSIDANVRGLVLASTGGGRVDVSGSIDAPQGFISLGTSQSGTVAFSGVMTSTTDVSRNGKIALIGGTVDIAPNAAIAITPDTSGNTIPQSPDSLAAFKASQIDIGSRGVELDSATGRLLSPFFIRDAGTDTAVRYSIATLLPSQISIGQNAIIHAPGADVNVGGNVNGLVFTGSDIWVPASRIDIAANAVIDVSGVTDYVLAATRNELVISPAKANELRDTPLYREVSTNGAFTLNGATLYLDPRVSGVRDDGVAWIGSPLIEAKSLAQQIGVTAPELMTRGGNITLKTALLQQGASAASINNTRITVADSAVLDFSGGWVRYQAGFTRTTKLVTADGRIVNISAADPDDEFVAIAGGFTERLPQLTRQFASVRANSLAYQEAYSEGRDAGSLNIIAPSATFAGTLHGDAFAGARQISDALLPTGVSSLKGDVRARQVTPSQLPVGGLLRIASIVDAEAQAKLPSVQSTLGGNIVVGGNGTGLANGTTYVSDAGISAAGLSGLSLQTSGSVTFQTGSQLSLAAGGVLSIDAGRAVTFSGTVEAAAGAITARTYYFPQGSIYTDSDDLVTGDTRTELKPNAEGFFDIIVDQGAILSVRGRWVNDSLAADGLYEGSAYTSGGSISLTSAPHIVGILKDSTRPDDAGTPVDLSGSVLVRSGALLDLSAGGYVSPTGALSLTGRGGNLRLINESMFFQLFPAYRNDIGASSGFGGDLTTFLLTPESGVGYSSGFTPEEIKARVELEGTVRAFGFSGGGTFELVTPDLNFGNSGGKGTQIGLNFLEQTGFGTLDLTTWNTALVEGDLFNNGRTGKTGLLATEQVRINAGETLNLTQTVMRSILTLQEANEARGIGTGEDISQNRLFVAAAHPEDPYLNDPFLVRPAQLILGGLTELANFGRITGAAQASITASKIYNAGSIEIAGGSITQREILPDTYADGTPGVGIARMVDAAGVDRGDGLAVVFGDRDPVSGKYNETGFVTASYQTAAGDLTVRDLISGGIGGRAIDRQIYYTGLVGADQGIVLTAGSIINLSGAALYDPLAPITLDGGRIRTGRMVDGGTVQALGRSGFSRTLFTTPTLGDGSYSWNSGAYTPPSQIQSARQIFAASGSVINIGGGTGIFDIQTAAGVLTPTPMWSAGGTLSAQGGGNINGATINARGGDARAAGGTLEWLSPTLVQNQSDAGSLDFLSATQIEQSGFDSFVARRSLGSQGQVDINLGRSFFLKSLDISSLLDGDADYYAVFFNGNGNLTVTAPHIGLIAAGQQGGSISGAVGSGSLTLRSLGGIDVAGSVNMGAGYSDVLLDARGDLRLIGVAPIAILRDPNSAVPLSLSGALVATGDLTLRASQIYATTGTGQLASNSIVGVSGPQPFLIASLGGFAGFAQPTGKIRFERSGTQTPAAPLSAGTYLRVFAETIEQAGILRAPLGRIDLGERDSVGVRIGTQQISGTTKNVTLEAGSITSVSANGLTIPYGTTVDLTEYYFSPTSIAPITTPPAAELHFGATDIRVDQGATVDATGGGSLYAYEFVSGTGGSRDVLSRFNSDLYSGNDGFTYADGRQVYAILPAGSAATAAMYDPLYSSDYGALYGSDVGKMVRLDGGAGVAAGDYLLLPAKYALLPGAMRLVENVDRTAPLEGIAGRLPDGSLTIGGVYGVAGTELVESMRRSFTVQSQETFLRYSRIVKTDAATLFAARASKAGLIAPRLPTDAARLVFDPGKTLRIDGAFRTDAASGGRGSQVDIIGQILTVLSESPATLPAEGAVLLTSDLANLNASSLLIGGLRADKEDGTTSVVVRTNRLTVATNATNPLRAPEILLAVTGDGHSLTIDNGASIVATGSLSDTRDGDYVLAASALLNAPSPDYSPGAFLRVANGVERFVSRVGEPPKSEVNNRNSFLIGTATISGQSATFDTSRNLNMDAATLQLQSLALSSDSIYFSTREFGLNGLIISPELEKSLQTVGKLTLRSSGAIGFTSGEHVFRDLSIDAPGLRLLASRQGSSLTDLGVTITAGAVSLSNSFTDLGCGNSGPLACGGTNNSLTIAATSLRFGDGVFRTSYGFDTSVALTATAGAYYAGKGTFDAGRAAITLTTPFLVDLGVDAVPDAGKSSVDFTFMTSGAMTLAAQAGASKALPTTPLAPGARLAFGTLASPVAALAIDAVQVRATAGTIDVRSQGNITLGNGALLSTPGYSQTFGDAADSVTVSAGAGSIVLVSKTGGISGSGDTRFNIGAATGKAGTLNLIASSGQITLAGAFADHIIAAAPQAGASFIFDAGASAFDLPTFASTLGSAFTGNIAIRTGVGDLAIGAGQTLRVANLSLTSDGGSVRIGGTVDTSGINGGDISLYARDTVELLGSARLDAYSLGYADTDTRQASAGDVILGVGDTGNIAVRAGAAINLGTDRSGNRLVGKQQTDPRTGNQITAYTFVEADKGGTLTLRAPVDDLDVNFAGTVSGARDITLEAYRRYDLEEIANSPAFSGVTLTAGQNGGRSTVTLDVGAVGEGRTNFLADKAAGTLVEFIQDFTLSDAIRANLGELSTLDAYNERPGVELYFDGDIKLASNWNLGAGELVDIEGALAKGLIRESALGPQAGSTEPRYEVMPGKDAAGNDRIEQLFREHVRMLYRVDGQVDGAAGRLTLRAGGDLNIGGPDTVASITDGFFSFGDQTDTSYIDFQLGGGLRYYRPSLSIRCPAGDCSNLNDPTTFVRDPRADNSTGPRPQLPILSASISLTLSQIIAGEQIFPFANAPYSAGANGAAATGNDPLGSAQLFPLLADGTAVDSFSYRLVGGSALDSANPWQIDRGSGGKVNIAGEKRYSLESTSSSGTYQGDVQVDINGSKQYLSGNLFDSFLAGAKNSAAGLSEEELSSAMTRVSFGGVSEGAVEFLRDAAESFFQEQDPTQYYFVGPRGGEATGFAATFDLVAKFLQSDVGGVSLLEAFGSKIGEFGYKAPNATGGRLNPNGDAIVRTLVRTGTGSIDIAAASDIDMRNGDKPVLHNQNNGIGGNVRAQVGGTAVYTAGHVVNPALVSARVAGTSQILSIDPTAYLPSTNLASPQWQPTPTGRLQVTPHFATGGGSISLTAGGDILSRRDVWSEDLTSNITEGSSIKRYTGKLAGVGIVGAGDQRWRVGQFGVTTDGVVDPLHSYIRINAQQFSSGVGALGGGDVVLAAGGNLNELTVAVDTTMVTGKVGDSFGQMLFGGGNLDVKVGHDLSGGRFDISTGVANFTVAGSIGASPTLTTKALAEIRLTDTAVSIRAGGSVAFGSVSALGVKWADGTPIALQGGKFESSNDINGLGYYTGTSALDIIANGVVSIGDNSFVKALNGGKAITKILPSSLNITSFGGNIDLGKLNNFLYPSATGQLSLLAGGTLSSGGSINMDDGDSSLLPGLFSSYRAVDINTVNTVVQGRYFLAPAIFPTTTDAERRQLHYELLANTRDQEPVRIAVGGDLENLTLYVPKQARISAGGDILNMVFVGQNLRSDNTTRIVAGRDITSTAVQGIVRTVTDLASNKLVRLGNIFLLGGPGSLSIEAGRDLGPFLNSATIRNVSVSGGNYAFGSGTVDYAGGILALGNDYNPWLAAKSADVFAFFGVANGMNFDGLRETYVNPVNAPQLDGDLFEQFVDTFGNKTPDRSRPIYSPILISWMQENAADALIAAFGTTNVTAAQAYGAFASLPSLTQRRFLLDKVYFNELSEPSRPAGNSYLQYVRGYQAVDTLFPAELGYTANDLSGASNGGTKVQIGNLDLRLAAIETTRGGNITILGPGGNAILGSVIRTSAQAESRGYMPQLFGDAGKPTRPDPTESSDPSFRVLSIPLGYEGILSLRGGTIHSFTDGDLRLNQSRLFSQQSGDIVLWSSNGDLNAGQGPKSAASVPPIVVRINPNGGSEVDAAGGVTGAGIAGFAGIRRLNVATGLYELVDAQNDADRAAADAQLQALERGATVVVNGKSYRRDVPTITLIAPAGTVDAGDAGVRAAGDIFVAAAQIANADNFQVGGTAIGIPGMSVVNAPVVPANAAAAVTANMFRDNGASQADALSRITVDVLGFYNFDAGNDAGDQGAQDDEEKRRRGAAQ